MSTPTLALLPPVITVAELTTYARIPEAEVDVPLLTLLISLTDDLVTAVVGADLVVRQRARLIALEVARRAWSNPEGMVLESVDDYSGRRADATAAAGIYLTNAETQTLRTLAPTAVTTAATFGVTRLRSGYDR